MTQRDELLAALNEKIKERDRLLRELQKSLAIGDLWPGCFKLGRVSSYWYGNVYKGLTFVVKVTTPEGEVKEAQFDYKSLPDILRQLAPTR